MHISGTRTNKEYTTGDNGVNAPQANGQISNLKRSTRKNKKGLLYGILSKKQKKRCQRGSMRKRTSKKQSQIRKYFEPATAQDSADDTAEETEEEQDAPYLSPTTIQQTRTNAANVSSNTIQSQGGDTIEPNVNNTFCVLSNNVNGFNTNNESTELIDKLTILKELKISA
eukprot:19745-Ditylum_brightwellii.AAC.1